MYKLLLCWRYLKTRYLAFACIISVMLGVATLIVVNSVMNGFSTKLKTLLHSVLSDVVIESQSMEGFHDPIGKMAKIRRDPYLNDQIEAMAITLEAFAMVQFRNGNNEIATRPVRVLGIDMKSRSEVGGFHKYLAAQKDLPVPNFDIPADLKNAFEQGDEWAREQRELDRIREEIKAKEDPFFGIPKDLQHIFEKEPKD